MTAHWKRFRAIVTLQLAVQDMKLDVEALLGTVWEVLQMSHGEEGLAEDTGGDSPVLSIEEQHALQQRHKFPPVCFLCLHVAAIGTQH